ncbi:MAG TPA: 16S rRNA (adenine(1518)-N(6)/adenine(1519)-N(6))-dimethyltransferase RsmA [Candidatus Binatia bacterium]|nr:16S rRNA (adenine(1518)-N(6)/adenine(1519)-N(6))-dimethyltransferase RsmA [Candidatus Binatia bacterium]
MTTLYEEVRATLRESEFRPRKRLGQNFLVHENIIESILRLLDVSPGDEIVEIGPGLGFLTRRLVDTARRVWAVEIDSALVNRLKQSFLGSHPAFHLIHNDILKVAPEEFLPPHKVKLVGNLPYSISTAVLFRLFDWREHFSSLVLMMQKEVGDRIASGPATKAYGTLSVWCQVHGRITERVSVSPEAFFPKPKVRSTILRIDLYQEPLIAVKELPLLRGLVRAAFGQRRKTLGNALTSWLQRERNEIESVLRLEGIDPMRRGETLRVEEFLALTHALRASRLLTADG